MTDQTAPQPTGEQATTAMVLFAVEQIKAGKSRDQVEQALQEKGLSRDAACKVVEQLLATRNQAQSSSYRIQNSRIRGTQGRAQAAAYRSRGSSGRSMMILGAVVAIIGLVVTIATYSMAKGSGGGSYIIAWGAILWGGYKFFQGLTRI